MHRRTIIQGAGAALAGAVCGRAAAQSREPITAIVPFPPGGGTDTSTRIIMKHAQASLGTSIVVDNRPGGNTIIGMQALVNAEPNGRTLGLVLNSTTANQTLYKGKLPYSLYRDLAPVCLTHGYAHVLIVSANFPANSFKEFVAYAKANPGKVTFASAGTGSVNHLAGELLKNMANLDMLHVPYKGIGSLMPDLIAGRIDALFGALPTALDLLRDKRVRILAVTTPKRQPEVPDLPAIAEFYPGYSFSSWMGYMVPAATPAAAIERLNAALVQAVKDPQFTTLMPATQAFGSTPQEFLEFLKADERHVADIITKAGVKLD
ncbi:MAG: Bug family tripartite tricarboxylate transporter substrate binding protein [Burkholderiaceae bacterium]